MNSAQTDQSLYRSLEASNAEIRVIRLHRGSGDEETRCTLETVSLDDQPVFHALSYVWGSSTGRHINVDGHVVPVTSSLAAVLENFRCHHHDYLELHSLPLWIDAVCINQADPDERAQQVRLMGRIYRQASRVLLWIGEGDVLSDHAFDRMNDATFRASCGEPKTNSRMPTLDEVNVTTIIHRNIEMRRYWTRVWILQEVVLATRDPVMICGSRRVFWSWYTHCEDALPFESTSYPSMASEWDKIRTGVPFHGDYDGRFWGSLSHIKLRDVYQHSGFIGFGNALVETAKLNVTDSRDHVYGVLGLVPSHEMLMVDVNYDKIPEEVFRDTMAALWTSGSRGLIADIIPSLLSEVGISGKLGVPSWVPDLSRQIKSQSDNIFWLRNTSRVWRPERQAAVSRLGRNVLTMKAIKFDSIAATVALDFSDVWSETFHRGKASGEMDIEPLQDVEAMVHRGRSASIPPSSHLFSFLALRDNIPIWSALTAWMDHGHWLPEDNNDGWLPGVARDKPKLWEILLGRQPIPESWKSACPLELQLDYPALEGGILSPLVDALKRKVTGNKAFTTQFGFLGVGTKQVEPGDVITLIAGMHGMYVFRPFRDGYRIVGFADVSGLMDWDDLDEALNASSLQEEDMKIY